MSEPTRRGAPCSVCGKPIGPAKLRLMPYATTCSGRCFVTETIRAMPTWALAEMRANTQGAYCRGCGANLLAGEGCECAPVRRQVVRVRESLSERIGRDAARRM